MTQLASPVRDDLGRLMVLAAQDVDARAWEPMPEQTGVFSKALWRSGDVAIGLIRVDAGAGKHEVTDVGPQGVTFFYTYRPVELGAERS